MVAIAEQYLGRGMYSPSEAAMYARISSRMMSRWVHGDKGGSPAIIPEFPASTEKTVTFLDFIQTLALRAIREQQKVSLQKIREAIDYASTIGIAYPFARRHSTYLFDDDVQIHVEDKGLIQASGNDRGQFTMKPIVEMYLDDLSFNADGLAEEYRAYESHGVQIVMRPDYRFGEPVIRNTGHTAWTLWKACLSEGGVRAAAEAYGVTEQEVRVAYKYIDSIRPATPA